MLYRLPVVNEQLQEFLNQATQSIQTGQFSQALDLANQAITLDPSSAEAQLLRAIALSQTGQPDAATLAFQESIRLDPSSSKANFNFAVHQYQRGNKTAALDLARKATALDPNHVGARELTHRIEQELGVSVTDATAPQNTAQNPYEQGANYNRPQQNPAAMYGTPEHSVAFVENMGSNWMTLGYALAGIGALVWIGGLALTWPMMMAIFSAAQEGKQISPDMSMLGVGAQVLTWFGYLIRLLSIGWMCFDIADRRGNWVWILPQIICCCCGLQFAVQLIYQLTGRK